MMPLASKRASWLSRVLVPAEGAAYVVLRALPVLHRARRDDTTAACLERCVIRQLVEDVVAALVLDEQGGLHLLWLDKVDLNAPTRLFYSYGALKQQ